MFITKNTEGNRNGINRRLSEVDIACIKEQAMKNSSTIDTIDIKRPNILDIAFEYLELGFSVIPVEYKGKKPIISSWKQYQESPPSNKEIELWFANKEKINIGIVLGKVSGNVICVDFDVPTVFNEWEKKYIQIAKDTATSKTGKGYHVLLKLDGNLPANFKPVFNGKEFGDVKSEGGYIVVPPSTHENGQQYSWIRHPKEGIYKIKSLSEVGIEKKAYKEPALNHKLREPESTSYGITALSAECEKIISTQKGNRNNQLFISASAIFELVAGGEISLTTAHQKLKDTGLSIGLPEKEIEATLKSAKEHGFKNPRTAPPTKKQETKKSSNKKVNQPTSQQVNKVKTIGPYSFIEPNGFSVTNNAVNLLKEEQDQVISVPIAYSPIIIVSEARSLDTKMIDLKLAWKRENSWQELWTSRETIADSRKIIALSSFGVPVHSKNAAALVSYLSKFEVANESLIPKKTKIERCGWKTIQEKDVMVVGQNIIQPESQQHLTDIEVTAPPGFENYIKAFRQEGSFKKWRQVIETITEYPIVMFQLYASFTVPFLALLSNNQPNFVINVSNEHSTGKTSSLYPAASIWGFPVRERGGLITSWNVTKVGIENIAYFCNNLPVFLDDLQNADDETIARIIYMFANGIGRIRGALRGIRTTFYWQGILFSNGEKPLSGVSLYGGADARIIDIWGLPFGRNKGEFIDRMKATLSENYGHAGPEFMLWAWDKIKNKQTLVKSYNECQRELAADTKSEVAYRVSHYFAAIWTIAKLVDEWLKLPSGLSDYIVTDVFDKVVGEQQEQSDKPRKALDDVLSWVGSNMASFLGTFEANSNQPKEVFGIYREDEYIAIYPHKLEEYLTKKRYNYSGVLKVWKDRGWIKTYKEHLTYLVMYENKRQNMIYISLSAIPQEFEEKKE